MKRLALVMALAGCGVDESPPAGDAAVFTVPDASETCVAPRGAFVYTSQLSSTTCVDPVPMSRAPRSELISFDLPSAPDPECQSSSTREPDCVVRGTRACTTDRGVGYMTEFIVRWSPDGLSGEGAMTIAVANSPVVGNCEYRYVITYRKP